MKKLLIPIYHTPKVWAEEFPAENGFAGSLESPETDTEIDW